MTAPQPSPYNSGPAMGGHDPWGAPPRTAGGSPGRAEPGGHRAPDRELRAGAVLVLPVAALTGLLLGLLWPWLAPRVPLVSDGEAVYLENSESQEAIAADGTFLLLGLAVGAIAGVLVFLLRRRGGVPVVLGLALGALLGALAAWRLGVWLDFPQDVAEQARSVGEGVVFDAPLELSAKVALLGLPFGAVAGYLACTALWGPRDPEAPPAPVLPWSQDGNGRAGGFSGRSGR
ncbi:ABC transporter permease [Streptomyces sp. ACA25]|uniref:ABC transporter permease n=1 Tax=Streptomyces sp. ACA25 TaxID=3022596 RepID=UPI0023073CD3|nr:ABC transporter permease [Streptomyces sp. ACA25]MDB1088649.1 ABC transporter permease [Streptomyces sp. ACA25]